MRRPAERVPLVVVLELVLKEVRRHGRLSLNPLLNSALSSDLRISGYLSVAIEIQLTTDPWPLINNK